MKHYVALRHFIHTLALLGLATVSGAVGAQGVPAFNAADETVIMGPGVPMPAGAATGTWTETDGRFAPTEIEVGRQAFYFPESEHAQMRDGFIRARFDVGSRLDVTLLFRASYENDDLEGISGYGFSIEKKTVRLYRWDNGVVQTLSSSARINKLRKRDEVEVVIWMIGPHINASFFDAETLDPLTTLMVTDTQYTQGRIGLRVHERTDERAGLTLLSVRPAGLETGARPASVGSYRFVALTPDDYKSLSRDLQRDLDDIFERDDGTTVYKTTAQGLERIRREGIEPKHIEDAYQASFFYLNREYRKARDDAPRRTDKGYDLNVSYKSPEMIEALLKGYHERYPDITRLVEIGRSVNGQPIHAIVISDNPNEEENEPAVFLNGAHHGVELLSSEFVLDAIAYLLENHDESQVRRWIKLLEIWCVPLVNPDGRSNFLELAVQSGRKNGRDTFELGTFNTKDGVDLNRNYPFRHGALGETGSRSDPRSVYYRGPRPASEPETQAVMRTCDTLRFASSISYHTWGTAILAPYTIDDVVNPEPNEAWSVAEEMAAFTPEQPNGRKFKVKRKLYSVDGVDQDWIRYAHGTLALLVEGAYNNPDSAERRQATVDTTRPTWMFLLDRYIDGPAIFGNVRDEDGNPLVAEIRVKEIQLNEEERWMTRCRDGRFDRYIAAPGNYTVQAIIGEHVEEHRVEVQAGRRKRVMFTFPNEVRDAWTLEEALCPNPELCAVDTLCAVRAGQCPTVGTARYCRVGDTCYAAGEGPEDRCSACQPETDHFALTPAQDGTLCGEPYCITGHRYDASTCDGAGACVAASPISCEPYLTCDGATCATRCEGNKDCVDGLACLNGTCAQPPVSASQAAPASAQSSQAPSSEEEDPSSCAMTPMGSAPPLWTGLALMGLLCLALRRFRPAA